MAYYSVIKKEEIISFGATWMDLDIVILSEVSQTNKDTFTNINESQERKYYSVKNGNI